MHAFVIIASGCAASGDRAPDHLIGQNSFVAAARYGTPGSYRHEEDLLQLNYGSEAAGCRIIMLVDQAQRVVGWASTGARCAKLSNKPTTP
ncbi:MULTISPECIES: hypothetical protein [unclassified Janthinobacterium]|uniref:hypothetical protein n=1 Tax=unclassified Janthinobacterium TaxID=2610881 RepID=UPI001587C6B3|nr:MULTISPECIES: hypothetical protein [unclassified Janthinobacterium]